MKTKTVSFALLSIFTFILLVGFASASLAVTSSTINPEVSNSTIINVNNTEATAATLTFSGDFNVSLSSTSVAANTDANITVNFISSSSSLKLGTNAVTITATAGTGTVTSTGQVVIAKDYCEVKNPSNNIKVSIEDISVVEGLGDDEEWLPLDTIEVELEVSNDGSEDLDNVELKWGLYNTKTGEFYIDDKESKFDVSDDDTETITISFRLDDNIDDLENGDWVFWVKATGEDTSTTNDDKICASTSQDVEVIIESDFVIVSELEFPETVQCGTNVEITGEVWNIGSDKQSDVYLEIYNKDLGVIDQRIEVGDIKGFESEEFTFNFQVPVGLDEKYYPLKFYVYDEDNDLYEADYDDTEAITDALFKVEGNCGLGSQTTVTASLASMATAGKALVVDVVFTNNAASQATYTLSAAGYAEWATSYEANPKDLIVGPGQTATATLTFQVKSDAYGEKVFDIEAISNGQIVVKQPVSVEISKASFWSSLTGGAVSGDNSGLVWGIGILNVILIVVIILVAIRLARR